MGEELLQLAVFVILVGSNELYVATLFADPIGEGLELLAFDGSRIGNYVENEVDGASRIQIKKFFA